MSSTVLRKTFLAKYEQIVDRKPVFGDFFVECDNFLREPLFFVEI